MKKTNHDENIHIGRLFAALLSHWKTFALICSASLLAGTLFWLLYPKQYKTTATMLLISDQQDMASQMRALQLNGIASLMGGGSGGANIDDQTTIISSTEVLGKTIGELQLQVQYKTKPGSLGTNLFGQTPVTIEFLDGFPPLSKNGATIALDYETPTSVRMTFEQGAFSSVQTEAKELPATFETPYGRVALSPSKTALTMPVEKLVVLLSPFDKCYEEYKNKITINTINPISNILEFEIEDECRPLSAAIVQSLIENYNLYSQEQKRKEGERNNRFVEERLREIEQELSDYEYKIEAYKKRHKLTDIETDVKLNLSTSESYKAKQTELEVQQKLLEYVLSYLNDSTTDRTVIPIVLSGNDKESPVSTGITAYNALIGEQIKLKQASGKLNPALISLNAQIDRQRKNLTESIQTYRQSIDLSIKELNKTNSKYSQWIGNLPTNEREFLEIKRQQAVKEALLVFLLQKREEVGIGNNPYLLSGRSIDSPHHSFKHTFPKGSVILPASLIAGFILSLLTVAFREFCWRKTISTRSLHEEVGLPLFMKSGSVDELASRILRSSVKVVQLIEEDHRSGADELTEALLCRLIYAQKQTARVSTIGPLPAGNNPATGCREINLPPDLSPYSEEAKELFDRLKAENDILFLRNKPTNEANEAIDYAPFADLSLCICRPDITLKTSVEKYQQWGEAQLFHRLELLVNPLSR